jgi:peptidoglycan glycosyltransferase
MEAAGRPPLDLIQGTEISSNIYYAHAGLEIGGPTLLDWASRLGFGAPIPFELPTEVSLLTRGEGPGGGFLDDVELANAAYGQAQTFVTPLQMALVAACVGNDGILMRPHLADELRDPKSGQATTRFDPQVWQQVLGAGDAAVLQEAMNAAVEGERGQAFAGLARVPGVPTAGKSGTAQLGEGEPHSWFIGFAPVEAPRIAIAVIVERGGRGRDRAVPLAGELMTYYLGLSSE